MDLGCWIDLPGAHAADIVGGAGFDFAVIDCEHGVMGLETASVMLMALAANGTRAILRVPDGSEAWIKRALDAGAAGVLVPRVETAAEAAAIVAHARYAPQGARGEALGVVRAGGWGRDAAGYRARWLAAPRIAVQIESAAGLAAVDSIAAVSGLTELFFGPADYAASIGVAAGDPRVDDAAAVMAAAARAAGLGAGTLALDPGRLPRLAAVGYTSVAVASDVAALVTALDTALARARQEVGHEKG